MRRAGAAALAVVAALIAAAAPAAAQLRRIPAELTPIVESDGVRPGTTVRAALQVSLPDGFHVQSNKPRDPLLIPTELALDAPAGVEVVELVFPEASDFKQEGLPEPLLVFERQFAIGVRLSLDPTLRTGELAVPARLRYQACDDKVCFKPESVPLEWTLKLKPLDR